MLKFMIEYANAITVKEIKGRCIETIPVGTKFRVAIGVYQKIFNKIVLWDDTLYYRTCKDLGVSSVWLDEFQII